MRPPLTSSALAALIGLAAWSGPAQAQAESARAQGQFVRALTAQALGDDSTAARLLDVLLADSPDPTVLLVRAEVSASPAEALYYTRLAVDAAPGRSDAHLALGRALVDAGQTEAAAQALDAALRLAPSDLDVLLAVAETAALRGDGPAEQRALAALVRVGDSVAARLRLSALAEGRGDRGDALAHARAAARLAPAEPAVQARVAALSGDGPATSAPDPPADARPTETADALLAALDDDPRRIETWVRVLDVLSRTADARAGATADDALLLFGAVPAVVVAAAEAYHAAGRPDDARATAQRGLDLIARLGEAVSDAASLRARLQATLR